MFPFHFLMILASSFCCVSSQARDRSPTCRQIRDVFDVLCVDEASLTSIQTPTMQAIPGKRGPPGTKGDTGCPGLKGEPGVPGIVNYTMVNLTIDEEMDQKLERQREEYSNRINVITTSLLRAELRIDELENVRPFCQIKYRSRCFWVHIDSFESWGTATYSQSETICHKYLATPANIYSEEHYDDIYELLRQYSPYAIQAGRTIQVWTGMRFNIQAFTATFANGTAAPFSKWYPGNPTSISSRTHIGIDVKINRESSTQHMYNWPAVNKRHGVICEK